MSKGLQAGIVFGILLATGCGQAEFKEFSPPGGGFKALMPGTPKTENQSAGGINFKNYSSAMRNGAYVVSVAEMPIAKGEPDEVTQKRLDGAAEGMVKNVRGKLTGNNKITLDSKYPGRDVNADLPDNKGVIHARIYLVGTKLYQTMAIGAKGWVASPDTSKFLDSMSIVPK